MSTPPNADERIENAMSTPTNADQPPKPAMSTPTAADARSDRARAPRKRASGPPSPAGGASGKHGLCRTCLHVRILESERGSVFLFCQLSRRDPSFSKYPPQPVRACIGFESSSG